MSPAGAILAEYAVTVTPIVDLTSGPDGNLWFIDSTFLPRFGETLSPAELGKVTTSGGVTRYFVPQLLCCGAGFEGITSGPNGNIWGGTTEYDLH